MTITRRDLASFSLAAPLAWAVAGAARAQARPPQVIATGGGTAELPADTSGAFDLAIREGADVLAADFFPTRDGALAALRDHEISGFTDVAARPEFADRRQTRTVDGEDRTGWFAEDFALAELKTLVRAVPAPRRRGPPVARAILTFEEVVAIARAGSVRTARVIGVQASLSHSTYFAGLGLAVEPLLASAIKVAGYNSAAAAMVVASSDLASLKVIGELTRARRLLRMGPGAGARDTLSPNGVKATGTSAEAVAAPCSVLLDLTSPKSLPPTSFVGDAHAAGLAVQAWTSAADFPPPPLKAGDARRVLAALFAADVDAVAGDHVSTIARARDEAVSRLRR